MSGFDNISFKTRTYTGGAGEEFMSDSDYVVIYENSGPVGAYLPSPFRGRNIFIVNATSSGVNIISQQALDGVPGAAKNVTEYAQFIADGANWYTLGAL